MKIREIVRAINSLELGITAIYGYSDTKENGIYVIDTLVKDITKHNKEERIQILICMTKVENSYLKIRELAEKIKKKLDEMGCYGISMHYVGEYQNKHNYSINLSIGGI
ncbi:hypothetical protein FV113G1_13350 [Fusobacterium varium]|nr:hypothetical protein FV113G1_13350 [Fusobacterium varium]